ncbi:MAG: hypothetical protein IVW52_12855 [Acidimicrobiales bacterium]|nr:hypothetical protein [Acidimicrobiales bacterium]
MIDAPQVRYETPLVDGELTVHEHPVGIFTVRFKLHRSEGYGHVFLTTDEGEAVVDELLTAGDDEPALRELATRFRQIEFGPVDVATRMEMESKR